MKAFDLVTYLKMEREILTSGSYYDPNDIYNRKKYVPLVTRSGLPARIMCIDRVVPGSKDLPADPEKELPTGHHISVLVRIRKGAEESRRYNSQGRCSVDKDEDVLCFTEIHHRWRVIYRDPETDLPSYKDFLTQEEALKFYAEDPVIKESLMPYEVTLSDVDLLDKSS